MAATFLLLACIKSPISHRTRKLLLQVDTSGQPKYPQVDDLRNSALGFRSLSGSAAIEECFGSDGGPRALRCYCRFIAAKQLRQRAHRRHAGRCVDYFVWESAMHAHLPRVVLSHYAPFISDVIYPQ